MRSPKKLKRLAHLMLQVAPGYFDLFGPVGGVVTLVRQLRHRLMRQPVPFLVRLRGVRDPLALRPHSSDRGVLHQVFVRRDHELPLAFEPKSIVDAGANAGYASVFFANRFPRAKIVALEVAPGNFELLKLNTAKYGNVIPIQAGLWGRTANLLIENPNDDECAFRVREVMHSANTIPAITVPSLLEMFAEHHIDLLKMDIEGAELEVFAAQAGEWLEHIGVLMVELHDRIRPGCTERVLEACAGAGLVASWSGEYLVMSHPSLLQGSERFDSRGMAASR
jgi:FkbM family methyltransferase